RGGMADCLSHTRLFDKSTGQGMSRADGIAQSFTAAPVACLPDRERAAFSRRSYTLPLRTNRQSG
ncbi:MAG TPA: hypothetical protein VE423_11485, partial [Microvirga sp.]|nr:hypothetical protein [Microvirga sp.]